MFNTTTGGGYTIGANPGLLTDVLTLDNGGTATVTVTSGTHEIAAPVELANLATTVLVTNGTDVLTMSGIITKTAASSTLTKTGDGKLNLNGSTMDIDNLAATDGTTNVNGTLGSGSTDVNVSGGAGTVLVFGLVSQTLDELNIGAECPSCWRTAQPRELWPTSKARCRSFMGIFGWMAPAAHPREPARSVIRPRAQASKTFACTRRIPEASSMRTQDKVR